MNILLLNASPKDNGATQEILNIIQTQIPSDVKSEIVCLGNVCVKYCLGDKSCYETCKCIVEDDMEMLLTKIDKADKVIIAAPSYWADVPAQFKSFIDRCTAYSDTNPNPERRKLRTGIKCYGIALRAGMRTIECEHIIDTIEHWCGHMGISMVGSTYFCSIDNKEDILQYNNEILARTSSWVK